MIHIWFEPHSTTIDNKANLASGWNDVDLSEIGQKQSLELIDRSRARDISAIYCSDLQRAVKTAVPTSNALHVPIYADERLRECNYGDFTQKPKDVVAAEKISRLTTPFPNGESYQQVIDRMKSFLDWLLQSKHYEGKSVLVIGHRATHYGLDHWIDGKPLAECVTEKFQWQPGWEYELR